VCISGVVKEQLTGQPIYGAQISYEYIKSNPKYAQQGGCRTNSDGIFTMATIAEGTIHIEVEMIGYQQVKQQVPAGRSMEIEILLEPREDDLAPKRITGEFTGVMNLEFEMHHFEIDEMTVTRYFGENSEIRSCWVSLDPKVAHQFERNAKYQVACHGTLHGPGEYGHFGMSDYELVIENVIKAYLV
jgi:hypothetical protein